MHNLQPLIATAGIVLAALFILNLLVTAFGDLKPGKLRRGLNKITAAGVKIFIIYIVVSLIVLVLSSLPHLKNIGSLFTIIFTLLLTAAISFVFLSGIIGD